MSNQIFGQAQIKVDGDVLETDASSSLDLGGPKREPVTGDYRVAGYRETVEPSKLETSVFVKSGWSAERIRQIKDATITVETDTGQTYVIAGGWCAEAISISQSDGKAKCVFQGPPAKEIL